VTAAHSAEREDLRRAVPARCCGAGCSRPRIVSRPDVETGTLLAPPRCTALSAATFGDSVYDGLDGVAGGPETILFINEKSAQRACACVASHRQTIYFPAFYPSPGLRIRLVEGDPTHDENEFPGLLEKTLQALERAPLSCRIELSTIVAGLTLEWDRLPLSCLPEATANVAPLPIQHSPILTYLISPAGRILVDEHPRPFL